LGLKLQKTRDLIQQQQEAEQRSEELLHKSAARIFKVEEAISALKSNLEASDEQIGQQIEKKL